MSDTTDDPVLAHLRQRKEALQGLAADTAARLNEVEGLLGALTDGRTRVRRKMKEPIPLAEFTMVPEPPPEAA